jgi:hypothetical protein
MKLNQMNMEQLKKYVKSQKMQSENKFITDRSKKKLVEKILNYKTN